MPTTDSSLNALTWAGCFYAAGDVLRSYTDRPYEALARGGIPPSLLRNSNALAPYSLVTRFLDVIAGLSHDFVFAELLDAHPPWGVSNETIAIMATSPNIAVALRGAMHFSARIDQSCRFSVSRSSIGTPDIFRLSCRDTLEQSATRTMNDKIYLALLLGCFVKHLISASSSPVLPVKYELGLCGLQDHPLLSRPGSEAWLSRIDRCFECSGNPFGKEFYVDFPLAFLVAEPSDSVVKIWDRIRPEAEHLSTKTDQEVIAEIEELVMRKAGLQSLDDDLIQTHFGSDNAPAVIKRVLKRHGLSLRKLHTLARLTVAKQLLSSGLSIAQASDAAGFSDPSSLSRSYQRHFGRSPNEAAPDPS